METRHLVQGRENLYDVCSLVVRVIFMYSFSWQQVKRSIAFVLQIIFAIKRQMIGQVK